MPRSDPGRDEGLVYHIDSFVHIEKIFTYVCLGVLLSGVVTNPAGEDTRQYDIITCVRSRATLKFSVWHETLREKHVYVLRLSNNMAEASDGKVAEVGKAGESDKDTPPTQVDGNPKTGDSTGKQPPVEPQNPDTQTASGGGDAVGREPLGSGQGSPPPPENVEQMDTTEVRDDTRHERAGDDTVQDSDEEKGPGGAPVIKHYTYAGTRIPNWIVTHYPDLVATLQSPGDQPNVILDDWDYILWSSAIRQTGETSDLTVSTDFLPLWRFTLIRWGGGYLPGKEMGNPDTSLI